MKIFERKPTTLDIIIEDALVELAGTKINTQEYIELTEMVSKLTKLKEQNAPKRVSPDTMAVVAGNLFGILLVLHYEHAHVVVSKAFGSILKLK